MPAAFAVLDTNAVLDIVVWDDRRARPLRDALLAGELLGLGDDDCRAELRRVLAYPALRLDVDRQLAAWAAYRSLCPIDAPTAAPEPIPLPRCRDADDQKFLALAVRGGAAWLITRDKALLTMARAMRAVSPRLAIVAPEHFVRR